VRLSGVISQDHFTESIESIKLATDNNYAGGHPATLILGELDKNSSNYIELRCHARPIKGALTGESMFTNVN
jgi:hypothetical protein